MDLVGTFCRQIRARSKEHNAAIRLLQRDELFSQLVAILRQELDSMIRVIYLLSISDRERRAELMQASVDGRLWKAEGSNKVITDREMVNLAEQLHGWTESVYRFGCAFIHLSHFHDYRERDPMEVIPEDEKVDILNHMRHYHGGPETSNPSFNDLLCYLPRVFQKVSDNLMYYVELLEADKDINDDEE